MQLEFCEAVAPDQELVPGHLWGWVSVLTIPVGNVAGWWTVVSDFVGSCGLWWIH